MADPRKQFVMLDASMERTVALGALTPNEIWANVLTADEQALRELCGKMKELVFSGLGGALVNVLARVVYELYQEGGGWYLPESDLFADKSGVLSRAQMALVQRQYTWAHALCSTATFWDPVKGAMACMRSLDWPEADAMASATRIYRVPARGARAECAIVGLVGMVGVLTGVRKGAFSVAINYAPGHFSASTNPDPTFRIRELVENAAVTNYDDAVSYVKSWRISSPCFITLCGIRKGEGVVIEFGEPQRNTNATATGVRAADAYGLLVQTNHFESNPVGTSSGFCDDPSDTSVTRRAQIEAGLPGALQSPNSLREVLGLWQTPPVLNYETTHVALMHPVDGEVSAWRCEPATPPKSVKG